MKPDTPGLAAPETPASANSQRDRAGIDRLWRATLISLHGFRAAWAEASFRQEVLAAALMLPASLWLGNTWVEVAILTASVLLVLIVELLNTAIEAVVDRVGPEWHLLSKSAKDVGSAAVLLSLLLCAGIWATASWQKFVA
ncbi:MAG: diacylglycerol kinase [Variovorax sp.]